MPTRSPIDLNRYASNHPLARARRCGGSWRAADLSAPTEASAFLAALGSQPSAAQAVAARRIGTNAATPPAASARLPVAEVRLASDDDLRARVVDLRRALDGLLAMGRPRPSA